MSKHTPGPWVLRAEHWMPSVVIGESVWHAATITGRERPGERDANARLIAAAPDLLAALKEMLDKGEGCAACGSGAPGCGCRYERARAAISKAEGES